MEWISQAYRMRPDSIERGQSTNSQESGLGAEPCDDLAQGND